MARFSAGRCPAHRAFSFHPSHFPLHNTARIEQEGDGNEASIDRGFLNQSLNSTARVFQSGDDNLAEILREGQGDAALIQQMGDGDVAHIDQTGPGNDAVVIQGNN